MDGAHDDELSSRQTDVLKKLNAGNQINGTVYKGDIVLHNVEVMPAEKIGLTPKIK